MFVSFGTAIECDGFACRRTGSPRTHSDEPWEAGHRADRGYQIRARDLGLIESHRVSGRSGASDLLDG
jgi:hypothetical protein